MISSINSSQPTLQEAPVEISSFRQVFQTTEEMKNEFVKFLQTIFYQLDEKKVLAEMEKILDDPKKSDEQIYKELMNNIGGVKKRFAPLWQLWSLNILKKGMGNQANELLKPFKKEAFHDYMEIYNRRYLNTLRKIVSLPLNGLAIAVTDNPPNGSLATKLEAGALLSTYPYKTHFPLNDPECNDPLVQPELTHKPISDEVADESLDLIACLGGLHHVPKERADALIESMSKKLRPGAVLLLRDHNAAAKSDVETIASVVHSFVNASDGVSWEGESKEIREFKSLAEWTEMLKKHQLLPVSAKSLVLKDDPTENAMLAFVKAPQTLEELQQAIRYRSDCTRTKDSTRATWIEWGNVRYSKQYAEFLQTSPSYAFDYIGHLRQHWQYFFHYIKESRSDDISLKNIIFSDNFAMNLFILFATSVQCSISYAMSLPSRMIARCRFGSDWKSVINLTELEKYEAQVEKEYSSFIDHTPFYSFDYIGKIRNIWSIVANSKEHWATRLLNVPNAALWSLSLLFKAAVSAPIRAIYTSESNLEPDTIKILIKDPANELDNLIARWEKEKDSLYDANNVIETVYSTPDGYKLVSVPRYRPFTQICGYLTEETSNLELLEVGSQREISVDVLLKKGEPTPNIDGARVVYEMQKLQDNEERRYATYHLGVSTLKAFQQQVGTQNIEYIHE